MWWEPGSAIQRFESKRLLYALLPLMFAFTIFSGDNLSFEKHRKEIGILFDRYCKEKK